jgi:hypothetical protein
MEHFYDGQIKRYINQFMRLMSNFSYKDGKGNLIQIPVRYGDASRQAAWALTKNSENIINSAPFIACSVKAFDYDRNRIQNPYHVDKINIRERAYDDVGQEYLNEQGENYTIERLMPSPFKLTFVADIWSTNTEQKLQILEQILVLFNPAMEIQTSNNFVDWTSLSYVELTGTTWTSRQIPQGVSNDIDIATLTFDTPVWITTPAKVKRLGIVTKIIANIFTEPEGDTLNTGLDFGIPVARHTASPGNLSVYIVNNVVTLIPNGDPILGDEYTQVPIPAGPTVNWHTILDLFPGKYRSGLSQLMFTKPDGTNVVGVVTLNPSDDSQMLINIDPETVLNTPLPDLTDTYTRGTINAIINPTTFNPGENIAVDTRYLILEDIGDFRTPDGQGPLAWRNSDDTDFHAKANDIIQWDGIRWNIIFDSTTTTTSIYITNSYTGIQYKWDSEAWTKSYEGVYDPGSWRLIL